MVLGALLLALGATEIGAGPLAIAAIAAAGLATASHLLGDATEDLAVHAGARWGGLVTALLGGSAELVVLVLALRLGWIELVRATIAGSIVANLLVVLGLSVFLGGLRHGTQYFSREGAGVAATMLILSVIALALPALYGLQTSVRNAGPVESLSEAVAVLLVGVYALSLYYSLFWNLDEQAIAGVHRSVARRPPVAAAARLAFGLVAAAALAALLLWAAAPAVAAARTTELFVALVLLPLVTTVAEHLPAVGAAWSNRMDDSMAIATGSGLRLAMLLAPLLVFLSVAMGTPMDLVFSPLELAALFASALVAAFVAIDGQSNWIEGVMLLAVYVLFALAVLWWPAAA